MSKILLINSFKLMVFNFYKIIKNNKNVKNFRYNYNIFKNFYLNKLVQKQTKDYKRIPIIIISYNQLFYLRKLINFLFINGYDNIVVIDNNSNYGPLLSYFEEIKNKITLHILNKNFGHKVFWKNKKLFNMYSNGYYVVTDPDIIPNDNCPSDFLLYFKNILDKNKELSKVGFSLQLDDIPSTNIKKEKIIKWEERFWKEKTKEGDFLSRIDTTFALYPPRNQWFLRKNFYHAIRTKMPFMAKHGGWYIDSNKLTDEQEFYRDSANNSSSWNVNTNGGFASDVCY